MKNAIVERLNSKEFWDAAITRALWTCCETFIATVGTAAAFEEVRWGYVLGTTAFATALSLAKSVVKGVPEFEAENDS